MSSVCLSAAIKKIRFDMQHPVRCLVLTPAFFKKKMQKESALIGWSNVMCYVWHFVEHKVKGFVSAHMTDLLIIILTHIW